MVVDRDASVLLSILHANGIRDPRVLDAFRAVPRERFVPQALAARAHEDIAIPIAGGQTMPRPSVLARMIEALEIDPDDRVLEVGTGSGYGAAVLGVLARNVFTIERLPELSRAAAARFHGLGLDHVQIAVGDGSRGWPVHAPYDAIIVSACVPEASAELVSQLSPGGRLVIPVGSMAAPRLVRIRREPDLFSREDLGAFLFDPLVGAGGYTAGELAAPER